MLPLASLSSIESIEFRLRIIDINSWESDSIERNRDEVQGDQFERQELVLPESLHFWKFKSRVEAK